MSEVQNIVIVGGGPAGAEVAKALAAKLNPATHRLIFITARDHYLHLPGLVRATVTADGNLEKFVFMSYGSFLAPSKGGSVPSHVQHKVGQVVNVTSSEDGKGSGTVTLENGEVIQYSILVLATGNTWSGPLDLPDDMAGADAAITRWRNKFEQAKSVVVVGGGSVGIEYVGEIRDFYPNAKVTLVHSEPALLNAAYPEKWRRAILARIRKEGVAIVFEDRVDQAEPVNGVVTTQKGKKIEADLIVPAWGGKPNTAFLSSLPNVLASSGHIKVKPTLQLESYPRIFAAGDIIDWKEQKQAAKAGGHAAIVTANVLALIGGGGLKEYKGATEMILVTVGRNGGSAYFGVLWGLVFGDWMARMAKSKGLMIDMTRGHFGFETRA